MNVHLLSRAIIDKDTLKYFFGKCDIISFEKTLVGTQNIDSIIVGKYSSFTKSGISTLTLIAKSILPEDNNKAFEVILNGDLAKEFETCARYAKYPESWLVFSHFKVNASNKRDSEFHRLHLRSILKQSQVFILFNDKSRNTVKFDKLTELRNKQPSNVFSIVNKVIKGLCYTSNKTTRHAMYSITDRSLYEDDSSQADPLNTFDRPIHVFLNSCKDEIPLTDLEEGDIVRIVGLMGDLYKDERLFGIVKSSYQLTVFRRDKNRNLLPKSGDPFYIYSERDQENVNLLEKWWKENGNNFNENDSTNMTIGELTSAGIFNLTCKLVGMKTHHENSVTILRVTDGTPTRFETKKFDLESNTLKHTIAPVGSKTIDVCVYNPWSLAAEAKLDMFLHLVFISCRLGHEANAQPSYFLEMILRFSKILFLDDYVLTISRINERLQQCYVEPERSSQSQNNRVQATFAPPNNSEASSSTVLPETALVKSAKKRKKDSELPSGGQHTDVIALDAPEKYIIECSMEVDADLMDFLSDTFCRQATVKVILCGSFVREANPCKKCITGDICLHDWVHGVCQYCKTKESPSALRNRFSEEELSTQRFLTCPNNCSLSQELSEDGLPVRPIFVNTLFLKDLSETTTIKIELYGQHASRFFGMDPSFSWLVKSGSPSTLNRVKALNGLIDSKDPFTVCIKRINASSSSVFVLENTILTSAPAVPV